MANYQVCFTPCRISGVQSNVRQAKYSVDGLLHHAVKFDRRRRSRVALLAFDFFLIPRCTHSQDPNDPFTKREIKYDAAGGPEEFEKYRQHVQLYAAHSLECTNSYTSACMQLRLSCSVQHHVPAVSRAWRFLRDGLARRDGAAAQPPHRRFPHQVRVPKQGGVVPAAAAGA